ncbi:MAG TPA: high-affinity nickel-transport family protein [Polyangiaceae bacterium]|jgi:high-affinity nickel-transport protein|nr:high-affinity nickel-transport family protein [Polyangiaceae bacterium]
MGLLAILALGFFLGMRHATDSDHIVAMTTIVSREKSIRAASMVGALWGVGHTLTILLVGGAIVLFGLVFPPRVGLTMELSVAIMLVVLGAMNVAGFRQEMKKLQALPAGAGTLPGAAHDERDPHRHSALSMVTRVVGYRAALRSIVIGTVHGLAGSAAVALLVLTTIRDSRWALLYLFLFGIGTIAGMMLITSALAVPLVHAGRRFPHWKRHIGWVTGVLSVGFGLLLVYQIGFVDGLFGASPRWAPQ